MSIWPAVPGGGPERSSPTAPVRRLRAPRWHDPRWIVGLVLVAVSVALTWRVVADADHTIAVWAAPRDLPTGTALAAAGLTVARVHLDRGSAAYLSAAEPPPAGSVLVRPVGAGEILPEAAVGPAAALSLRSVVVPLTGPAPSTLRAAATVDVWANHRSAVTGAHDPARRVAVHVEVAAVHADDAGLGGSGEAAAELLVPPESLTAVLDALADDDRIALVVVPATAAA